MPSEVSSIIMVAGPVDSRETDFALPSTMEKSMDGICCRIELVSS